MRVAVYGGSRSGNVGLMGIIADAVSARGRKYSRCGPGRRSVFIKSETAKSRHGGAGKNTNRTGWWVQALHSAAGKVGL